MGNETKQFEIGQKVRLSCLSEYLGQCDGTGIIIETDFGTKLEYKVEWHTGSFYWYANLDLELVDEKATKPAELKKLPETPPYRAPIVESSRPQSNCWYADYGMVY